MCSPFGWAVIGWLRASPRGNSGYWRVPQSRSSLARLAMSGSATRRLAMLGGSITRSRSSRTSRTGTDAACHGTRESRSEPTSHTCSASREFDPSITVPTCWHSYFPQHSYPQVYPQISTSKSAFSYASKSLQNRLWCTHSDFDYPCLTSVRSVRQRRFRCFRFQPVFALFLGSSSAYSGMVFGTVTMARPEPRYSIERTPM